MARSAKKYSRIHVFKQLILNAEIRIHSRGLLTHSPIGRPNRTTDCDTPAVCVSHLYLAEAEDQVASTEPFSLAQITHEISLDDPIDLEESLDYFSFDPLSSPPPPAPFR
jgi:hypothetical protein